MKAFQGPRSRGRTVRTFIALLGLMALLGALAAGCGDDDGGSNGSNSAEGGGSADVEAAQERVDAAQEPIEFEPPGPKFDMSQNKGKTVHFIATTLAIPYVATLVEDVEEAAAAAGVRVEVFDGKSSAAEQDKGIKNAVAQNADGIILQAVDPKLVANSVSAAADAGIPIIDANNGQPGDPVTPGVFGHVTPSTEEEGRLQIDYAVATSEGDVTAAMINAPFFTVYKQRVAAMKDEIAEVCPDCELNIVDTDPTKPTEVPSSVASALRQNPDTNWVFPAFDSQMPQITQGINLANAAGNIEIVGSDNTPEQLALLEDANSPFVADVGNNVGWQGWAEIDLIGRAMAGEPETSYELPLRMFTKDNLPSDPEGNWTGIDYQAEFKALWAG